ncbi:MAG: ribose 5-phosphate isomerase, partial [Solirubrobacteraceae bacterium]|nr:ribose 5-phosphate isomerase [Solirubrobacteraceae bacterium]
MARDYAPRARQASLAPAGGLDERARPPPARVRPVSASEPFSPVEAEKRAAAEAAALLVPDGARVGLGTGSTVAYLLPALAARGLDITCVATSVATEQAAADLGLRVVAFDALDRLEIAIDGADQIDPATWIVKGGGGAHTREKIVAAAADRFVVIASSEKVVDALRPPVPLELLAYGLPATLRALAPVDRRDCPPSPDGGVIADYQGPVDDPAGLADRLAGTPGVVDHGLFPPSLVTDVIVGSTGEDR